MAQINLKRFVDVNIVRHIDSVLTGTRDTIVLYTSYGTSGTTRLIDSITKAKQYYTDDDDTLAYLTVFFNNGGAKVLVVENTAYSALTTAILAALDDKYVMVAAVISNTNREAGYEAMKTLAVSRAADSTIYGINEKFLLARTAVANDDDKVKNFCVKYSSIVGAEMTIAAYLSQLDVYKQNTVFDYMFTQEVLTAETISDTDYGTIVGNNMNVDIELANAIRNCGGNCKDAADLTNSYVKILLHQTVTDRLIDLLTEKVKGTSGISKMYNVIAQELGNYLACGYLTTDKIWSDDDLRVSYNNVEYTIIEKGTPLTNGYIVKILPFTALTNADKAERKAPPVYIILADQYTIRKITIYGEVI